MKKVLVEVYEKKTVEDVCKHHFLRFMRMYEMNPLFDLETRNNLIVQSWLLIFFST